MKSRQQSGFTLIELVMVIVILGILAVVAVPQFLDLRGDARQASLQGIAGALSSASAINKAACDIDGAVGARCKAVAACADVNALLQSPVTVGTTAGTYAFAGTFPACTINTVGGTAVNFTAIATP